MTISKYLYYNVCSFDVDNYLVLCLCGASKHCPLKYTTTEVFYMSFVKAQCTNCGAALDVEPSLEAAVCPYCHTAYIVQKAINNYTTNITNQINAQNVTVLGGKGFSDYLETARALLDVSPEDGLKACEEAIALQPTSYEARALYVKYIFNEFEVPEDAINALIALTPADKKKEVFDDLYQCWFENFMAAFHPIEFLDGYTYLLNFIEPEDCIAHAINTMEEYFKVKGKNSLVESLLRQRIWSDYLCCSEAYRQSHPFPLSRLCSGEEKTIFRFDNVWGTLCYQGKAVNRSVWTSPKGNIVMTNYKVTFQAYKAKFSFEKTLENIKRVGSNDFEIVLLFKDGYTIYSTTQPVCTAHDWEDKINGALLLYEN